VDLPATSVTNRGVFRGGFRELIVVAVLGAVFTLGLQWWVGNATIYDREWAGRRTAMHHALLINRAPAGLSWSEIGANSVNVRLGAVYAAEAVHRALGVSVANAYFVVETWFLWCTFPLLYLILRWWFPPSWSLVGLLYYTAVLPLTYMLHHFHPWDRPALFLWLVLIILLRADRMFLIAAVLVLAVIVKYDVLLFPGLYWLIRVERRNWVQVTGCTAALFAVSFGTYFALRWGFPGGFAERQIGPQIVKNLGQMRDLYLFYPPLLVFGPTFAFAVVGARHSDRFMRAMGLFGLLLLIPLFIATNFNEVRAQMSMFVLLLPAAVAGWRHLVEPVENRTSVERTPLFFWRPGAVPPPA
jgi:hypothetical protein